MRRHQKTVRDFMRSMGWRYWEPLKITTQLGAEMGELAEELNREFGGKQMKEGDRVGSAEAELGDITYALSCLANSLGFTFPVIARDPFDGACERDPRSIFAEIMRHMGSVAWAVDMWQQCPYDPGFYRAAQDSVESACRAIDRMARRLGCTAESALDKSIAKYGARDKDRFPDGV